MSGRVRDPYDFFFGEVLNIPPPGGDPDHYTILGLPFFEQDEDKIRAAGHDRKAIVRSAPQGNARFEHVREEMLERVREARRTLLNAEARRAYDAFLIGQPGGSELLDDPEFALADGAEFADRYRILREERRGGFGRIYSVLDTIEGRRCELTVLPPNASRDPGRRRRAERALRRLHALQHPAIVKPDAVGEAEGLLFARWVAPDGFSLPRYVDRQPHGRLEPEDAAPIADRIAEAVAHAHARGVVHGDLHPRSIFVGPEGQVLLTEFGLAVGAQPPKQLPRSPYTAPERALNEAADRYSLGAVVYFMLRGEAPFLDGGRGLVPKPLPDSVPLELATTTLGLLVREPSRRPDKQRFATRAVVRKDAARFGLFGRKAALIGIAALIVVVISAVVLSRSFATDGGGADSPAAQAWKLIEERRFADAVALLDSHAESDERVHAPLASALEQRAVELERAGDPYTAQQMLERAQRLAPDSGRQSTLDRVRSETRRRMEAVRVSAIQVTASPVVAVDPSVGSAGAKLEHIRVNGEAGVVGNNPLTLAEGDHSIPFELIDVVGNRREDTVPIVVDRSAPAVRIVEPQPDTWLRDGSLLVQLEIRDPHLADTVTIHGRSIARAGNAAQTRINLANGRHEIVVEVADRAGNVTRRTVSVNVDDSAPSIQLEEKRYVTGDGRVELKGKGLGKGVRLRVDGNDVAVDENGEFEVPISVTGDRTVELVATGPTGAVSKMSVDLVLDTELPRVTLKWSRRDANDALLYGTKEMDAGAIAIPLGVTDRTKVRFEPSEGTVADGVWRLLPHQGEREVTLFVLDEANNRARVDARLSGHRATPKLTVETTLEERTRDAKAALQIESDKSLFLNGKAIRGGRIELPLPEGEVEFLVQAIDPYGNTTEWRRTVIVDRTPPRLKLVGAPERGIGTQEIVLEADEDLDSITCLSQTRERPGARATFTSFLEPGREHIHVVARDLVGNTAKAKLPLRVVDRVLMLDGGSALKVPLPQHGAEFTVEFWARATPAVDPAVFVSRGAGSSYRIHWASIDEALPHALLHYSKTGLMTIVAKKQLRDPTDWHHYAFVRETNRTRFFIDGKQQGYNEFKDAFTPGSDYLLVGAGAVGQADAVLDGLIGRMDEVRVSSTARYSRAFTPARHLRADDQTQLMLRFDFAVAGRFPDSSKNDRRVQLLGQPRLLIEAE